MSIKIEQVSVKNLGPLNEFQQNFKQVNLIYGHNEHGKTYLVEFIYKSLFKNKALSLRDISGSGQVIMSGIEEKDSRFSLISKKKLEDFWEDSLPGLPRDFSKLFVVKGADLDFASSSPAGIDDKILKEFLSGEGVLEKIGSKIKSTEASATYENGRIYGENKGMVKEHNNLRASIQKIDEGDFKVNENISGGKRFELQKKIEGLKIQRDDQEKARRHLAFNIASQINNQKAKLGDLPSELLTYVDKNIDTVLQKRKELESKQLLLEKNREASKDYPWLEAALIEYKQLILSGASLKPRSGMIWLVFLIIAIVLAVVLGLVEQPYISVGMILLATVFGVVHLRGLNKSQSNNGSQIELGKISNDYKSRFGGSSDVQEATLSAKLKELQEINAKVDVLTEDTQTLDREITSIEQQINQDLRKLSGKSIKIEDWQSVVVDFQETRKKLDASIREKENDLFRLNLAESDYMENPGAVKFDPYLAEKITKEIDYCEQELQKVESDMREVKQLVCGLTGGSINQPWGELIDALTAKRQEEVTRYKKVTAGIIARIKVNEVLDDLRKIEDKRIEEGLFSSNISLALMATTGRYDRIEKEDGELYVADTHDRYRVADLSTGAREQVLLGLRIGFAARILGGTPMFLILDDAFQHSDWERRERLVEKLFTLANEGWQINYFTMDDHIRTLFESTAEKMDNDQYQTIVLS